MDRRYNIAVGNSCEAKYWANEAVSFEELCERLKNTKRTSETVEEYRKFNKDERKRDPAK